MEVDLAGFTSGHPERFVPEQMGGEAIAGEHFGRYWWAAKLAPGRRTLDAACGVGYGCRILAEAGASEVVGVDRAGDVLDAVREAMPPSVELVAADVLDLPFEDSSFDLIVSFETLEHVEHSERLLDEFQRVLAEDGVVAVSTPNRNVFIEGNPHHVRELTPEELYDLLAARFRSVRLLRQHTWVAAAILEDPSFRADGDTALTPTEVRKLESLDPGTEIYTLALASDAELPSLPGNVVLADSSAVSGAHERESELRRVLEEQQGHISALEDAGSAKDAAIVRTEAEARALAVALKERDQAFARLNERIFEVESGRAAPSAAEAELAALRATRLFRYSAPIRSLYGRIRRLAGGRLTALLL